jgi:hypothetical protein
MKIKVKAMIIKEIEVDDKFNVLALNDLNFISYPNSLSLHRELDKEIVKKTGFNSQWESDFSTPVIIEVSRSKDNSLMVKV